MAHSKYNAPINGGLHLLPVNPSRETPAMFVERKLNPARGAIELWWCDWSKGSMAGAKKKIGSSRNRVGKNGGMMLLRGLNFQGFVGLQGAEKFGTIPRCARQLRGGDARAV